MAAKTQQLRIEFRIVPIGFLHRGSKVVEVKDFRNAAEGPERIFQATDKVLRGLMEHRFAIRLARVAQHRAQDPRPATLTVRLNHRCSGAKIDLKLLPRLDLDAPDALRIGVAEPMDKP